LAVAASSRFDELCSRDGTRWEAIRSARSKARHRREKLRNEFRQVVRSDMELIVFGSLAREEWTSGSDIDWSLLVDGQTAPGDMRIAKSIEAHLTEAKWKKPGPSGVFGSLCFSHSLVHDIGGMADTHVNTTRRILLLLESASIGDSTVRDRVIRAILARYLEEDTHFHPSNDYRSFIPRFLLNDIVRYWRTIAVDYANKTREQNNKRWALRNIKLRMSRKLTFVSGLLMCFVCHLKQGRISNGKKPAEIDDESNLRFIDFLVVMMNKTPLEVLADILLERKITTNTSRKIFNNYNTFLETIDVKKNREQLESLTYEQAKSDKLFNSLRVTSQQFQEGLRHVFFEEDKELKKLTQIYAIF
jgi:predicted nucleotidyltransferase